MLTGICLGDQPNNINGGPHFEKMGFKKGTLPKLVWSVKVNFTFMPSTFKRCHWLLARKKLLLYKILHILTPYPSPFHLFPLKTVINIREILYLKILCRTSIQN